jgi:hypothetical protein
MVLPSGDTSSDIQVASDVVNDIGRSAISGSVFCFTASAAALSFCALVCARGACGSRRTTRSRTGRWLAYRCIGPRWDVEARL